MLMTFDAPDSNVTCTRRDRSNTPLQALTLLNDPVFHECAQALFFMGNIGAADPAVNNGVNAVSVRWLTSANLSGEYLATCGSALTNNKGCAYAMFNVFKGLKLQGISSLPAVVTPAGSPWGRRGLVASIRTISCRHRRAPPPRQAGNGVRCCGHAAAVSVSTDLRRLPVILARSRW
jgi:hypothetical protein